MKNSFTDAEIRRLTELRRQVDKLEETIDGIVSEATTITGEQEEFGYTFDFIRNGMWTVEQLQEKTRGR